MRSQGVPPTDFCHLDKSFVRPQSCDRFKPVFLAGAWLSHVDATVADNGYTGIDRKARKIVIENGERPPRGSNAILYLPRDKGDRGLRSVEMEYKATKIKSAVRLYCNEDPVIQMVREFEERAEEMGRRSMVKDAFRFAEELSIELNLGHSRTVKTELRKCQVERVEEEVANQRWQGSLVTTRLQDEKLSASGCFWWLTEWKACPTHTIAGMFELYEQLLPTRLYACQKTHTSLESEAWCRLCGKAQNSKVWLTSCPGAVRWHRVSTFPDMTLL